MGQDLREMVIMARNNDEVKLQLLKKFEPLMKKCIKIYIKDFTYFNDAMQEARLAMLQCINRYDTDSSIPFEGYVKRAIIYSIRDFAHRIYDYVSLDETITEDGGTLYDVIEGNENIEDERIHIEELDELMRAFIMLPENYKSILRKYYFEKMSLRDICAGRRCHYMTVVKLKERALKCLREKLKIIQNNQDK